MHSGPASSEPAPPGASNECKPAYHECKPRMQTTNASHSTRSHSRPAASEPAPIECKTFGGQPQAGMNAYHECTPRMHTFSGNPKRARTHAARGERCARALHTHPRYSPTEGRVRNQPGPSQQRFIIEGSGLGLWNPRLVRNQRSFGTSRRTKSTGSCRKDARKRCAAAAWCAKTWNESAKHESHA